MSENQNQGIAKNTPDKFKTKLAAVNERFMPLIEQQLTGNDIQMTAYQRQCVLMAIAGINAVLDKEGLTWNSPDLDSRNFTEMLQTVAALQLNAAAQPREVYFQTRNVRIPGTQNFVKTIEMGIEGDGNDAILRRFGADVKKVGQYWLVREGDPFVYPKHTGFEVKPPEWTETGVGKVVRVVYPIMKNDGSIEFYIAEREDVKRNLAAHVSQNLMHETFGIAAKKYNATPEQKAQIEAKKREIIAKIDAGTLDDALDNPEINQYVSPSWREAHSRESMIIRKMRNNVTKKIPKDFSNAYIATTYTNATDDAYSTARAEIAEHANGAVVDVDVEYEIDAQTGELREVENNATQPEERATEAAQVAQQASKGADGPQQGMFDTNEPF